jgi:hypothetical protein
MRRGKGHRATDSGVSDAENSMAASGSNKTVREGVSSRMSDCVIDFFDLEIWLCAPSVEHLITCPSICCPQVMQVE